MLMDVADLDALGFLAPKENVRAAFFKKFGCCSEGVDFLLG